MIGLGAGITLIIFGAVIGAPGLLAVGVIVDLVWILRSLWSRFGLRAVTYERRLGSHRAIIGEQIDFEITVRNRKLLPLPWLEVEDYVSDSAVFAGRRLEASDRPGLAILRTTWTLGWFQRVTRRLHIEAERRGIFEFDAYRLRVADLFASDSVEEERPAKLRYLVVPRHVPVRASAPLSELPGTTRVRRGLFEEPALFAGVRPYQPGDPLRRVHWKATARLGRPVSKRYDPVREQDVVIAMDAQTLPGAFWMMQYDDELVESLCVAAMSLARSLIAGGVACGLAVNAYASQSSARWAYLAPSATTGQIERIADQLADISRWASLPYAQLIHQLGQRMPPTTSLVALSARDGEDYAEVLRRVAMSGRQVRVAALGRHAKEATTRARALGLPATTCRLEPDWRTARALEMVG